MNNLVGNKIKNQNNIQNQVVSSSKADNLVSDDTFVRAIAPVIHFVQYFGILPVRNCLKSEPNTTTFKWISIPSIITIFCGSLVLIQLLIYLFMLLQAKVDLNELDPCVFLLTAAGGQICFLHIAINWNTLMTQWCDVERIFLRSPYKRRKFTLKLKFRIFSVIYIGLGFVQEGLFLIKGFFNISILINECHLEPDYAKYYYQMFRSPIYAIIGYNHFIGIINYYINISMTLCLITSNLVPILMSLAIAERFKQFNERLASANYHQVAASFWTECRVHHQKLTQLVNLANKYFGPLILVVCFFNIYFLAMYLFRSAKVQLPFVTDKIFFAYSFAFMTSSLWLTISSAAQINDLSKKSMSVLLTIPKKWWNIEAKRFMWQLQDERVALSGCNLFSITRGLILRLAATITTYGLMLFGKLNPAQMDVYKMCALYRDN